MMLQDLREKIHGWPAILLFGFLTLLLAGFGMEAYFTSPGSGTWVAKVGKYEISQQNFQDRMNQLRQQASAQQGDKFDASIFEKPETKQRVLDSLIDQYLLTKASNDMGMMVPSARVRQEIASISAFQVDGHFDSDAYRAVLANQRESPATFQQKVRSDLEVRMLPTAIADTSVVTDAQIDQFLRLRLQTRDLRYVMVPRPALTDTHVTDAQISAYYKAHIAQFTRPEQVSLKYIELDAKDVKVSTEPDDATLKARYDQEKNRFVQPEQREVSHILISVAPNATPAQQKAALAKADKIDAMAKAPGADFAALAKKYSDDLGSKRQGGDLGWIQRGVTNKAFETALFSMHKGDISAPVLSPEGYHIIDLRGVREGTVKPFADVRGQLLTEVAADAQNSEYSDVASKLTDETYRDPTTLEPAAKTLKLPLKTTALFSRDDTAATGIASNPKVVKAAFSDQVLTQGNNSNPIELGSNHIVVIHVNQHKPAAPRPLAKVKDQVRQDLLDQRITDAADKRAKALLAELHQGGDMAKVAAAVHASVTPLKGAHRSQPQVQAALLQQAFKLPHPAKGKTEYALVPLDNASYALLALDAVHDGDVKAVSEPERESLRTQMQQATATLATVGFIDVLKRQVDIKESKKHMQ